jgi:hypothetical protein
MILLLVRARGFIAWGRVKTLWKYLTGKSSLVRLSSHLALTSAWHFGQ